MNKIEHNRALNECNYVPFLGGKAKVPGRGRWVALGNFKFPQTSPFRTFSVYFPSHFHDLLVHPVDPCTTQRGRNCVLRSTELINLTLSPTQCFGGILKQISRGISLIIRPAQSMNPSIQGWLNFSYQALHRDWICWSMMSHWDSFSLIELFSRIGGIFLLRLWHSDGNSSWKKSPPGNCHPI